MTPASTPLDHRGSKDTFIAPDGTETHPDQRETAWISLEIGLAERTGTDPPPPHLLSSTPLVAWLEASDVLTLLL